MPIYGRVEIASAKDFPDTSKGMERGLKFAAMRAVDVMNKATEYLQENTPTGSGPTAGAMKEKATAWGLHIFGTGGFSFNLGWRRTDFPVGVFYPWFVLRGTGLYGPRARLIFPKRKKVLVFEKEGQIVVTPFIRGQEAHPEILENAVRATQQYINKHVRDCILKSYRETGW